MLNSIYHKLYFSFLGIFAVTVIIVLALSSHFYGTRMRAGMEDAYLSQARFFRAQYVDACGSAGTVPSSVEECEDFLDRVTKTNQVHFWVLDTNGNVVASSEKQPPGISAGETERAIAGEEVSIFEMHGTPRAILPIVDPSGKVRELLVVERSFWRMGHRGPPRFPFVFSLLIAGVVAALLVLPLSLRITRPVRELHRMGQEWAEGRLERRANVSGKDEISQLAGVFNGMADNLQKMIQQRKEFLALISHEMKSPLTRLRLSLELLSERSSGDRDVATLVKGMQEDIDDSENLIEQLLVISRLEMVAVNRAPVDLNEVLRQVVQQLEPVAHAVGVRVVLQDETPGPGAPVLADAEQLRRAFSNVLDNAIKFSPQGGEVRVRLSRPEGIHRVEIADGGAGIDPGELEQVFEPFYRGRSREQKRGSGLGLFIARRIIQSAGGSIHARLNQPSGTVITIAL